MAQTTGSLSWANCVVELSSNGSVWTDVSGFANSLSIDGGDRQMGEFFTCDGETPIVTYGKRNMLTITLQAVYTEDGSDPYAMAHDAAENHTHIYIRWSPTGYAVAGDYRFTSGEGWVTSPILPQGAADSPDAIPVEVVISCGSISRETKT